MRILYLTLIWKGLKQTFTNQIFLLLAFFLELPTVFSNACQSSNVNANNKVKVSKNVVWGILLFLQNSPDHVLIWHFPYFSI